MIRRVAGRPAARAARSAAGGRRCPRAWLEKHGARVADLLAARREDRQGGGARRSRRSPSCATSSSYPRARRSFERLAPLLDGFESLPEAPLPADLNADAAARTSARGVELARRSCARPASARCSPTTWASARRCRRSARCAGGRWSSARSSVVHNWAAEMRRFRPGLRARDLPRPAARARSRGRRDAHHATPCCASTPRPLAAQAWDAVVLDEAQAIKNPDSQVARAAFALRAELPRGADAARRSRTGSRSCGACSTSRTAACSAGAAPSRSATARPIAAGRAGRRRDAAAQDPPVRAAPR